MLIAALQMMEKSAEPVTPMSFLLRLRSLYPQFAQQNPPDSGDYMQQDAEECWTQLLYTLKETLQVSSFLQARSPYPCGPISQQLNPKNWI